MDTTRCQQLVTIESCCDPERCPEPTKMVHADSGAALCESHYTNGAKYTVDGTWTVGTLSVPMPDGWALAPWAADAAPALEVVSLAGEVPSGLVIESASLGASGLVLTSEQREADEDPSARLVARAGGEDEARGDG